MALESLFDFLNLLEKKPGNHRSDYREVRWGIGRVKKGFLLRRIAGLFYKLGDSKNRILFSILKQLFLLPGVDSALFSFVFSFAANNNFFSENLLKIYTF